MRKLKELLLATHTRMITSPLIWTYNSLFEILMDLSLGVKELLLSYLQLIKSVINIPSTLDKPLAWTFLRYLDSSQSLSSSLVI